MPGDAKALQACGKLSSNSANAQPHRAQKVAFIYSFLPSIKCKLQIIMVILMIHTGHPQWSSIQSVIHLWPHLRWLCLLTITSPISTPLGALTAASWLGNQDSKVWPWFKKVSRLGEMLKLTKMIYDESNEGSGVFQRFTEFLVGVLPANSAWRFRLFAIKLNLYTDPNTWYA